MFFYDPQCIIRRDVESAFASIDAHHKVGQTIGNVYPLNRFETADFDWVHADKSCFAFKLYKWHRFFSGYQIVLNDNDKRDASFLSFFLNRGEFCDSFLERFDVLHKFICLYAGDLGVSFLKEILDLAVEFLSQLCFSFFFRHNIDIITSKLATDT